jgi:ribonuclease HI/transposase InsO family protein
MAVYAPCDFSAINNYPHAIPEKAIEKLPSFQGNNAISAKMHVKSFMRCINKWCAAHDYEDVKMKLFVLSLEDDASDWYEDQPNNTFKTLKELIDAFTEKWGEKRDHRHLLAALNTMKKNENETMDEFNKRFNELTSSMHQDIKPPESAILIYYIEAFGGEMRYQLRDKEPTDLKKAQETAIKIDKNMQASGKSNLPGFTRGSSSKQSESKEKAAAPDNKDPSYDPLKAITEMVKRMEATHATQLSALQNRLIAMERTQNFNNRFQPRPSNERWQKKAPQQEQRPPNQLESNNVVNEDIPPFCRACQEFHEESTCPNFCQINEQGLPPTNNFVGQSRNFDHINNFGETHALSMEHWLQMQERCEQAQEVVEEYDNVTKLYGHKPTSEQILEMARHKGIVYKRKGREDASKSQANFPKVTTPSPITDLSIDLGSWISSAKMLVPVSDLLKIPSQKEKLLKAINVPDNKKVEKNQEVDKSQEKESKKQSDPPVILTSRDRTKEENPPFFVSLEINDQWLHNCMYDSGASSNIITKGIMQRLGLKVTRPYQNICAMDSREIETHGIIIDMPVKLAFHPDFTFKMDVLVIDVPAAWGMLLSRKWGAHMGGCLNMDLTFATIPYPPPSTENFRLFREKERKYHIEDPKEQFNEFICQTSDMGNFSICSNFLAPVEEKFKDEKETNKAWKMNFDGAHSRSGKGAGIVLVSPTGKSHNFAFRLEFDATNNVAEYEALLLGLEIAKDMGIKILNVKGDSDLVILQVKNKFACKSEKLKRYRNAIWDTIEMFDAMDIISVPREQNSLADSLAVAASTLQPSEDLIKGDGKLEIIFRPSVPDNVDNWQVFRDDKQILRFINNVQEFSDFNVSYKEDGKDYPEENDSVRNPAPRGIIALEKIFDRHDMHKKKKETIKPGSYIEINIGTEEVPRLIKIGKGTSEKERKQLISLVKEYRDVFAFTYDELKAYKDDVFQHTIPLKEDTKPFRQKLRRINPKLAPLIQAELKKMLDAGIIAPTRHSAWCSNLVVVRKKNGGIRLCIDFRNLNLACIKDNYPLPNMETLLQRVTGSKIMSMLDGFSGYNQVLVKKEDQNKTTFTTPWGTFEYLRMPFGLLNAGATFQRAMDYAFHELMGKIIEIYQDDLTVFSKERDDHISHLRQVFERCRKYGISLNPAKSILGVDEGKLLGHIITKDGVKMDPERVQAIQQVPLPQTKKALQSFLGQINFVRRFIPNLAETLKPLQKLLKKDVKFEWTEEGRRAFKSVKDAIGKSPVLISPNYAKDFQIFSFASEDTIAGVLLQKNDDGQEQPIAFMSKALQNSELNYTTMEKQAYALVKSLKYFRVYIGYSKVVGYVPHPAVKDILGQQDCLGVRGKWVSKIQEYDLEIKPTKLIKGQGLAQMLTTGNEQALDLVCQNSEHSPALSPELQRLEQHEWYADIIFFLTNLTCPTHLIGHKRRALRLKATKYCIIQDGLGWKNPDGIILRCVDELESKRLLVDFHSGFCGGHFAAKTTAHKILRAGYYWPTIFSDVHKMVRGCQQCQLFTGKQKLAALPLQPVVVEAPFQQWGLDFIGQFKDNSSNGYTWIITATDYFTKWVEAIPTKSATDKVVMDFLEDRIITRFGVPAKITTDNAKAFSSTELSSFCFKYGIILSHSSNYYPQGNGLAESSNKNLMTILKKTVGDNKRSWDNKIKFALWADRITKKSSTGKSPFELVYGLDVTLPVHLKLPVYQFVQKYNLDEDFHQNRIDQIIELDENRRKALDQSIRNQEKIKRTFDKSSRQRDFQTGDTVLLWDKRREKPGSHGKFDSLWAGPYIIQDVAGKNSFVLSRLDGEKLPLPVNGQLLKLFFNEVI